MAVLELLLRRRHVADRLKQATLIEQSIHSSVAISTASTPRHGPTLTNDLGLVQPDDVLGERFAVGIPDAADGGLVVRTRF